MRSGPALGFTPSLHALHDREKVVQSANSWQGPKWLARPHVEGWVTGLEGYGHSSSWQQPPAARTPPGNCRLLLC